MNTTPDFQPVPDDRPVMWSAGQTPVAPRTGRAGRILRRAGWALGAMAAIIALVGALTAWSVAAPSGSDPVTPLWIAPGEATTQPVSKATPDDRRSSSPSSSASADDHGADDPATHDVNDDHGPGDHGSDDHGGGKHGGGKHGGHSGSDDH